MYGQTTSMYKTLVDAYHTVLVKMRENNLVLPMAMIMAIVGGGAVAQKAAAAPTDTFIWNGAKLNNQWDNTTLDWTKPDGAGYKWLPTTGVNEAQFTDAGAFSENNGGTINVAGGDDVIIRPDNILFSYHGYILTGGKITIGKGGSDDANGDGIITVSGAHTEGSQSVPNVATINSVLDGGNALTKKGTGVLVLGGANVYGGRMRIAEGVLRAGIAGTFNPDGSANTGAFGRNSAVTIDSTATLALNGFSNHIGSLAGSGAVTFANPGYNSNNVVGNATLTVGGDNTSTSFSGSLFDGPVTNGVFRGSLTKVGSGTLTLGGTSTYTGATIISTGTLRAGSLAGLSASSAFTVESSGILDLLAASSSVGSLAGAGTVNLNTANLTAGGNNTSTNFSGSLIGTGNVTKTGTGTMTLSGASTEYHGTTTVNNGTLSIADVLAVGSGDLMATGLTIPVTIPATVGPPPTPASTYDTYTYGELEFNVASGGTVSNVIHGTDFGTVSTRGSGVLVFSGANDYVSDTEIHAGTLQAGVVTTFNLDGSVKDGAFGVNSAVSVDALATLDLNDFSNTVGSLSGAGNVTLGSSSTTTLTVGDAGNQDLSGIISGAGSVVMDSASSFDTQILSGNNTYAGGTTITKGTLQVGNYDMDTNGSGRSGTLGSDVVTLGTNGTLDFRRNDSVAFANEITGNGDVEVNMGLLGILTFSSSASDYTGVTRVNSGRLNVGTGVMLDSNITVDTTTTSTGVVAGMLGGPGGTNGLLTFNAGSYIVGVTQGAGAFRALGGIAAGGLGTGAFIMDGGTASTVGTPHTIDVVQLQSAAAATAAKDQFNISNYRAASLGTTGAMVTLTYTSGTRTWNSRDAVWGNMNTVPAAWQEDDGLFSSGDEVLFDNTGVGAGGVRTVTVNGPLTPSKITFDNDTNTSYILTGLGVILGPTSVTKNGEGTVTWGVDSAYSGATTINKGTFSIGGGGTHGSLGTGAVTVGVGGTLLFNRSDEGESVNDDRSDWVASSAAVIVENKISGGGDVGQVGGMDNVVIFSGNNDYTGATTVNSGQLWAGVDTTFNPDGSVKDGAFGVNSAVTVSDGATLRANGHNLVLGSLNGGGMIQMADTTLTVGGDNKNMVFAGQLNDVARNANISGGSLSSATVAAKGITILRDTDGNSINYAGQRISPSIQITSTTGSQLTEYTTLVDSAGSRFHVGGKWVDSTSGTKTEPDNIYKGKLWVFDGDSQSWYKVMLAPVDGSGWSTLGSANLIKTGSGTQTLSGDNTYTGATTINGGTLQVGNGGKTGTLGHTSSISIGSGATLAFNRSDNALVWGADSWRGDNLYPGGKELGDFIPGPRGALVVSGDISGTGILRQAGAGTTTLTGDNSGFGGAIEVASGTLRLGDTIIDTITDLAHPEDEDSPVGNSGQITPHVHQGQQFYFSDGAALGNASATVTVQNGGTLAFNMANDYTETHAIHGAGNVATTGANTVTMKGASDYTGATIVDSTVIRYMISGPASLNNLVGTGGSRIEDEFVYGEDAVAGAVLKAGVATTFDDNGRVKDGAFGVQSVVTVNAGALLDLDGKSNVIGALHSGTTALTDGNARVKEYLPDGEVHAGTDANHLGTNGAAVINFYRNNTRIGASSLAVGLVDLGGATLTVGDGNKSGDFAGVITGSGSLVKVGSGTQILSGDSDGISTDYHWGYDIYDDFTQTPTAFTGAVFINGGTLQLGNGTTDLLGWRHGSLGTGTVTVADGATFAFNRVDEMTVMRNITGAGNVLQRGTGVTNLFGTNSYTGTTQVEAGTLRAAGTNAFGAPDKAGAAVVNGGTLDLNDYSINFGSLSGGGGTVNLGSNTTTTLTIGWFGNDLDIYAGVIQGNGKLVKTGTGTQVLSGANTYTGTTTVSGGGTLKAGVGTEGGITPTSGAFGVNSEVTLRDAGSTLDLNGFDETIGSLTGDAGTKVVNGSFSTDSVLTITGTNAEADFKGTLADMDTDGANGHTLSLIKTGEGTQILSGSYAYSGDTTVNGGTLIFRHGATAADITTGNLSLGGATVQFDNLGTNTHTFASTTVAVGNTNKLVRGTGWTAGTEWEENVGWKTTGTAGGLVNLGVLSYTAGALDISNIGIASDGSTKWIKVDETQANEAILFNGLITANGGQDLVATDAKGYLIKAATVDFAQGAILGATGSPTISSTTAIRLVAWGWNGTNAGTPPAQNGVQNGGIKCVDPITNVASILNAYTTADGSSPLRMSNPAITDVTLSINSGSILRLGAKGSIVSAAGTGLIITGGTLTAGGADDTDGTLNINATNNITVASQIANNSNGNLDADGNGVIDGVVSINKVGIGALTISSPGGGAWSLSNALAGTAQPTTGSIYTGLTTVSQGSLKAGAAYALSAYSQVAVALGATLDLNNWNTRIGSLTDGPPNDDGTKNGGTVLLGTKVLTLGEDNADATFSGTITSANSSGNSLIKVGTGTQTLTGDNAYVGMTTIYQGTLQIGDGGSSGSLGTGFINLGNGTMAGTLAFNRSDDLLDVGNNIGGTGNVKQNGTGITTLKGNNTYTGATTVNKGILRAGTGTNAALAADRHNVFGSNSAVTVVAGATLDLAGFDNSIGSLAGNGAVTLGSATLTTGGANTSTAFSGNISGTGGLTKVGTGTLTLSGVNGYTGATTVSAGTLAVSYVGGGNDHLSAASSLVLKGGTLRFEFDADPEHKATQQFASTQVQLTDLTTPFVLSATNWSVGNVVDLGNLGGDSGLSSWVGKLDIQNLDANPSWIKTSDVRYASTFNWSDKAASGTKRVATDAHGFFILVDTIDYSQGGAIGADAPGPEIGDKDVVRLINTGYGGNVANAPVTLAKDGTTDVGGISNGYAAGTTNPSTETAVTLQIRDDQILRVGQFGVATSGAGTDLVLTGGKLTGKGADIGFSAGANKIIIYSEIADNNGVAVGVTQNSGTTVLLGDNTYTGTTTVEGGTLQVGDGGTDGNIGTGDVVVKNGGTLAFNLSEDVALDNALTGDGIVAQNNAASTLTISNADAFEGTIAANAGTVEFDSAASSLGGATAASGATLNFNDDVTVANINNAGAMTTGGILSFLNMANTGMFRVRSGGELKFAGNSVGTGAGTIENNGTVTMVNGSRTANAIVNNSTMGVTGTVHTGAITFNSGSVLRLTNPDALILSTGTVTVASGAKLVIAANPANSFTLGQQTEIIRASDSVTGTFVVDPSSASPGAGKHWVNATDGKSIYIGIQHTLASGGGSNTQRGATSDALITIGESVSVDPDIQGAITYLAGLSGDAYGDAYDRLSGHDRAAIDSVTQGHTLTRGQNILQFAQMQLVNDETVVSRSTDRAMRATALGDLEYGDIEDVYGLQFFVHAGQVTESRDRQTTGVLATEATGNIFTVGVHNQLTDNLNIGVAFTYDQTDITSGNGLGKSDATTYGLDLYFSHLFDEGQRWFISGVVGAGVSDYDNERSGIMPGNLTATGSASGTQFHVAGQLGYRADVWQDAILTPYAGLSMVRNQVDAYAESLSGAPGLALSYEDHTSTATEAVLGLNFAQGIHLSGGYQITPSVGVAWHHQLDNTDGNTVTTHFAGASGTTFNTYLGGLPDDAVEIQGAITVQIPGGLKVFIDGRHYESMGSSNGASQDRIGGGLRYDF